MVDKSPKSKGIINWVAATLMLGLLNGCFQTPFSTTASISASGGSAAVVQGTTDSGGRTSGSYDPNATYAQQLVASSGDIAGTSVTFQPGSLSFATTISVESGASLADGSALADLGLALSNAIASSGASVIIRPAENVTLVYPMSLSIPLPAGYGLTGLSLGPSLGDDDRLAILAKVFDANGELKSKLIPRKNITIENGNAKFDTMAFGAFQTVVMEQPVTEAVEAQTSEPIANKNGVAVITSSGVVAATEIAAAEQKKPLTFQTFTASFSTTTRKVTIASKLSESILIKSCSLTLRDVSTKAVRFSDSGAKDESTDSVSAEVPLPENVEGNLEAAGTCESKDGRIARSDWTSIGKVAKAGFGFTRFVPTYFASTREVKIEGEIPQSSAAIASCTFKFRNAATPYAVVYEATKTAGTSAPAPILLPYNISGSIEISATCVSVDKQTASTAWTALGTVAPGANGTVATLPDTNTSVRVSWTVPSGTSQTTQFKVERATSLSDFDSGSGLLVTVADWFKADSVANGPSIEKTATGLTTGTKYFFRVATRNCETCDVLYFPVVPGGSSSSGISAGGGGGNGSGTAAAGGGTGGVTGNSDTTAPTITEYASVSHLAPGQIHLRTGRAYDNTTTSETLLYKLVYSSAPITSVSEFDAKSTTVFRDWTAVTNQTIVITSTPTTLKYYTLAVKDAAGNIALHPSLGLMLPGQSLPTIDFNSDLALNMKVFPYVYGSITNSSFTATALQYKISAGTKPGSTDLIPVSTAKTITLPASGTASFSEAPILPTNKTLNSGQTYYANLSVLDSNGAEVAELYAPVHASRPFVLYEFENNGLNSGASASWVASGQTSPYPASVPTDFIFGIDDEKKNGSYSAKFDGTKFMDVPSLNLLDLAGASGAIGAIGSAGLTGFTMGGWVYQTSTETLPQTQVTAFFGIDNFLEFGLGLEGNLGRLGIYVGAMGGEFSGSTPLPVNSWHHVVVSGFAGDGTHNGRVAIYLDGDLIASPEVSPSTSRFDSGATATDSFKIGGAVWNPEDTKFTGFMDDVFFSPWAYSDNAIRQMSQ